jgi:hypothetical protein
MALPFLYSQNPPKGRGSSTAPESSVASEGRISVRYGNSLLGSQTLRSLAVIFRVHPDRMRQSARTDKLTDAQPGCLRVFTEACEFLPIHPHVNLTAATSNLRHSFSLSFDRAPQSSQSSMGKTNHIVCLNRGVFAREHCSGICSESLHVTTSQGGSSGQKRILI